MSTESQLGLMFSFYCWPHRQELLPLTGSRYVTWSYCLCLLVACMLTNGVVTDTLCTNITCATDRLCIYVMSAVVLLTANSASFMEQWFFVMILEMFCCYCCCPIHRPHIFRSKYCFIIPDTQTTCILYVSHLDITVFSARHVKSARSWFVLKCSCTDWH